MLKTKQLTEGYNILTMKLLINTQLVVQYITHFIYCYVGGITVLITDFLKCENQYETVCINIQADEESDVSCISVGTRVVAAQSGRFLCVRMHVCVCAVSYTHLDVYKRQLVDNYV